MDSRRGNTQAHDIIALTGRNYRGTRKGGVFAPQIVFREGIAGTTAGSRRRRKSLGYWYYRYTASAASAGAILVDNRFIIAASKRNNLLRPTWNSLSLFFSLCFFFSPVPPVIKRAGSLPSCPEQRMCERGRCR